MSTNGEHMRHSGVRTTYVLPNVGPAVLIYFPVCFVTMIPLQRIFDWCAEEAAVYLGQDLQSFVVITLNKSVLVLPSKLKASLTCRNSFSAIEATLAIILLLKCE